MIWPHGQQPNCMDPPILGLQALVVLHLQAGIDALQQQVLSMFRQPSRSGLLRMQASFCYGWDHWPMPAIDLSRIDQAKNKKGKLAFSCPRSKPLLCRSCIAYCNSYLPDQ